MGRLRGRLSRFQFFGVIFLAFVSENWSKLISPRFRTPILRLNDITQTLVTHLLSLTARDNKYWRNLESAVQCLLSWSQRRFVNFHAFLFRKLVKSILAPYYS